MGTWRRSGGGESNSRHELGTLAHYHCATAANGANGSNETERRGRIELPSRAWDARTLPLCYCRRLGEQIDLGSAPEGKIRGRASWGGSSNMYLITHDFRLTRRPRRGSNSSHLIDNQAASPDAYEGMNASSEGRQRSPCLPWSRLRDCLFPALALTTLIDLLDAVNVPVIHPFLFFLSLCPSLFVIELRRRWKSNPLPADLNRKPSSCGPRRAK